ncbi:chaplin [Streptomyces flavofungini]|uniref:chaplin n=1 Tax=Streptomyces flavofungini TaxID=68200 RepID=UPI0034E036E9
MSRIAKVAAATVGAGAVVLGGAGMALADADASGAAVGSPGVISGNNVAVPINIPVNLCGNTVDVVGLLNPAFGNTCSNAGQDHHGGYGS